MDSRSLSRIPDVSVERDWVPTKAARQTGLGPFKWWDDVDPNTHYAQVGHRLFQLDDDIQPSTGWHYYVVGYEIDGKEHHVLVALMKQPGGYDYSEYTFVTVQRITKAQVRRATNAPEAVIVAMIMSSLAANSAPVKKSSGIHWPSHWDKNKGWPTADTVAPDGRTFGELARLAGVDLEAACKRLGKGGA
jgi:hypothetical protein